MEGVELVRRSCRRRRLLAVAATVGATLLVVPAAHAQLPGGPGAVDQYVEDVPTGGGSSHPTKDTPTKTGVPSSLADQIAAQGGSDAPLLTEVVSSSAYGAPQEDAAERMERGDAIPEAAPAADEAAGILSSAVTAVEGGDAGRLLALLLALLAVSIATVVAVGARQRRSPRA